MAKLNHPGRQSGCTCPTVTEMGRAVLLGLDRHLCKLHDADTIDRTASADEKARLVDLADQGHLEFDTVRALVHPSEACTCTTLKESVRLAITEQAPPRCPLHDPEPDDHIALNDNEALARRSGFPLSTTTD